MKTSRTKNTAFLLACAALSACASAPDSTPAKAMPGYALSAGTLTARLDPAFPGLMSYSFAGDTVVLGPNTAREVLVNGERKKPEVAFRPVSATQAEYRLSFPDIKVSFTARAEVEGQSVTLTLADLREDGDFVVKTLEIPELALLTAKPQDGVALGNFPGAYYATEKPEDMDRIGKAADLVFPAVDADPKKRKRYANANEAGNPGASYAFVSDGKIAAGLWTNVLEENLRMIVAPSKDGAPLTVAPGKWTVREIPTEILPAPQVKLVVAADSNGDGLVDWQDAALAYRKATPAPYGAEKTKAYPIAHISMNFASQATNPFLRALDNAKKVWAYTDGLGQRIQFKGFESEGHDSSHPDYAGNVGVRQGGRDELCFMMRRGHDFNVLSGIHINAQEYHKESKYFRPDLVDEKKVAWCWLDESYATDYRYDSAYGTLYERLDAMRDDLPWLDFVYLDVYYGRGWPGWRMHTKTNSLGLLQHTEFPGVMERAAIWNHVANDWTQQVWGKGDRSEIARFVYFSTKSTFRHDPLLRGTNCDGFMGWHGETKLSRTIESAFTVNIPTAYLQHFNLLKQSATEAKFTRGVRTEVTGDTARIYGPDGQLVNVCRYPKLAERKEGESVADIKFSCRPEESLTFVPWDPIAEDKIYHWSDKGGDSTWTLPKSWAGVTTAKLYRLTDTGRVFERDVAVKGGEVTLAGIPAKTPFVLYRCEAPALPEMKWSEGGLVADTGFDSHTFRSWKKSPDATGITIENDADTWQTELVMRGAAAGEVRQDVSGLVAGKTYAASVWVNIAGKRDVSLAVEQASYAPKPFVDPNGSKLPQPPAADPNAPFTAVSNGVSTTLLPNHTDTSSKHKRAWHRLKVVFTAPESGRVALALRAAADAGAATVKFDDVRLVKTGVSVAPAGATNVVLFEDFENVDEGWGPFMYGFGGDMRTHLSEANPPYTDDTIGGKYSLKSRKEPADNVLYRTVPATLKLKPDTTYRVKFDAMCDTAGIFAFVAGPDGAEPVHSKLIEDATKKTFAVETTFKTDARPDWWIGMKNIAKEEKKTEAAADTNIKNKKDTAKEGVIIIDNVLVEEVK